MYNSKIMNENPKKAKYDRVIELDVDSGNPRRPIHGDAKSTGKHEEKLIDTRTGEEIRLESE